MIEGIKKNNFFNMRTGTLALMVIWTLIAGCSIMWNVYLVRDQVRQLALLEARANFNKDHSFRLWAASHGGVYVPVTENTPPNPNLAHLPERDITTPSGNRLTLMNPAYMVRQLMESYKEEYGIRGRITSLNPIWEGNAPDEWERKALRKFEKGAKEVFEFSYIDGKPYLRLMRPMITEEGCLKCHAYQGYKIGDVRGGVGVSIPIAGFYDIERGSITTGFATHMLIWVFGLAGIWFAGGRLGHYMEERDRVAVALAESERSYRALAENLPGLVYRVFIREGNRIKFFNHMGMALTGYTEEELRRTDICPIENLIHPDDLPGVRSKLNSAVAEKSSYAVEYRLIHKDGGIRHVIENGSSIYGPDGIPLYLDGIIFDITESKKAELDLENIFNLSVDLLCIASLTHFTRVSPSFMKTLGYTEEELLSIPFMDFIHPDDIKPTTDLIEQKLKLGAPAIRFRNRYRRKDFQYVWLEWMSRPIPEQGVLYAVARDVTESMEMEELLRERDYWLTESQRVGKIGTYSLAVGPGIWKSTPLLDEIFGIGPDYPRDVQGWAALVHPDDREAMTAYFGNIISERIPFDREYRIVRDSDGVTRWVHGRGELSLDLFGVPVRMIGTIQDINERREAQEKLRDALTRLEATLNAMPELMFEVDADGVIHDYKAPGDVSLYAPSEIFMGKPLRDVIPADAAMVIMSAIAEADEKGYSHGALYSLPMPGGIKWFSLSVAAKKDPDGGHKRFIVLASDITDLKSAQERIAASLVEKDILLKEVHHRVKNNMAIISALLGLQARRAESVEIKQLVKDSQNRIMSMALVHEKLYKTDDFSSISIREYVSDLARHLKDSEGSLMRGLAIELDIHDIPLTIDSLIPCGLILNEMITNSMKHAFRGVQDPRIDISIKVVDSKVSVVYIDNGVGIPGHIPFPTDNSLGLQIIGMLSKQLGGEIVLDRHSGTMFTLVFPLKKGR